MHTANPIAENSGSNSTSRPLIFALCTGKVALKLHTMTQNHMPFTHTVAKSIALSILLWKDATPTCTFPTISELVSIELMRLLSEPRTLRTVPGLPGALEVSGVGATLTKNPWEVEAHALLSSFIAAVPKETLDTVELLIDEQGHKDVVLDMIRYRKKTQTNSAETIDAISKAVCDVLKVDGEKHGAEIRETYDTIYKEMIRV
jgi:hypothetical protein